MEKPINFFSTNDFTLKQANNYKDKLLEIVKSEGFELDSINFIFCSDEYLLEINQNFLNHDTFTDIITFDYTENRKLAAEIYISTERISENAKTYKVTFDYELQRVMVHGILHCCGYKDKTDCERKQMRAKENEKLKLFHVEQN